MNDGGSSRHFGKFDENIRAIEAFLEERDARRRAGLLVRELPPEDVYLQLDERLKQFQAETQQSQAQTNEFQAETRLALAEIRDDLRSLREQMATKADVESLRVATQAQLESLHGDIRTVAEGFANVQARLDYVAGLVRQYISSG
jgi:hypothetical protein